MVERCVFLLVVLMVVLAAGAAGAESGDSQAVYARLGRAEVLGAGPGSVEVDVGVFDILANDNRSWMGLIEGRSGRKFHFVGPGLGLLANSDGGYYAYGGLYADIAFGNVLLTPFWGAGRYEAGESKDLGGNFMFISSATIALRTGENSRLGLRFIHISNGDIYDINPGADMLLLGYGLGF